MHPGDVVWANTGEHDVLALFVKHGNDKDTVQMPNGNHVQLGYREPEDRDANGAGMTWWKVR